MAKNGRGMTAGLRAGDLILTICGRNIQSLTHDQVKSEILRAGNDLDLLIKRLPYNISYITYHKPYHII